MAKVAPCALVLILVSVIFECSALSNQNDFTSSKVSNISDISTNEIILDPIGNVSILGGLHLKYGQDEIKGTLDGTLPQAVKTIALCQQSTQDISNNTTDLIWDVPSYAVANKKIGKLYFKMIKQEPYCGNEAQEVRILPSNQKSQILNDTIGFRANGYLMWGQHFYSTDEYCVNKILDTEISIHYCAAKCTGERPCINKCLPPGDVVSYFPKRGSVSSGQLEYFPNFYKFFPENKSSVPYDGTNFKPHFIQQKPNRDFSCKHRIPLFSPYSEDVANRLISITENLPSDLKSTKFVVLTDGRVLYEVLDDYSCPKWREIDAGQFCVDGIRNIDQITEYTNHENEGIIFSCGSPREKNKPSLFFGIGMIVSSVFLLMTVVVYCFLWHQQNIHGWTIMAHSTSMFFAYIFLGTTHIIAWKFPPSFVPTIGCYLIGVLAHFFFLSTFCWLFLISFDLWWTFRSITPAKKGTGLRLLLYILIGWGMPGVIVLVSICLDLVIGTKCSPLRLPRYGHDNCYVIKSSLGLYIYYPIGILLVCNMGFFCMTLFKLYHYKKNSNAVAKSQSDRGLIALFAKLFFVVGVTWIFEFISWLHVETEVTWYWAIMDVINILQSVAIFIIYVCKQDIRESLEKAYPRQCQCLCGWWSTTRGYVGRNAEAQPCSASNYEEEKSCKTKTSTAASTP